MRVPLRSVLHDERGNVLATVMIVSVLVGALAALTLQTGTQADKTSKSDRNHDVALGVAEAGEQRAISDIQGKVNAGQFVSNYSFSGDTPEGHYDVDVTRTSTGFVIDSQSHSGGERFGRPRHVRVTMAPPPLFNAGGRYALFSYTSIEVKNSDEITGDIWANDSITIGNNAKLHGSMTAAQSWIKLEGGATVDGDAWSGGYNPSAWAMYFDNGSSVGGGAKASVSAPSDPDTCQGETHSNYNVPMGNGSSIANGLTTLGAKTGTGTVNGTYLPDTCTPAAAAQPVPAFTFNRNNYDQAGYHEFSTVADFQTWLAANSENVQGTFNVQDPAPSQTNRIDLSGASLSGDTLIYTNAPVFTNGIDDANVSGQATFVIVSTYSPPISTSCDINHDNSECAVHVKNNFDQTCKTAVLIHAANGPVSVKNQQTMCGTIIGNGILIKNTQFLDYADRLDRVVGFGESAYEIKEWQELPS